MTTHNTQRDGLLDQTVAAFGDNPTLALLALSRRYGIAVHYQDRSTLEARLDHEFTDEEWQQLAPTLEDYDEWLENSGAGDSIDYWVSDVLADDAGLTDDATDEGEFVATCRGRLVETITPREDLL
ncbi:MAG: hypothetical protein L0H93_16060 [Nocardioides sp.]|nr:hypothetical protein [Nocardioides sp.]